MQTGRIHRLVLLDHLDGAVERVAVADVVGDLQRFVDGRGGHRELVDQPVAEMHDVAAAAAVHQHVVLAARIPGVETVEDAVERRPRDQFAILGAEDADGCLGAAEQVDHVVAEQRLEQTGADAEHDQIVGARAPAPRLSKDEMIDLGLARQQRIDHVRAEPVAEIAVVVRHHRDAAGRDRLDLVGAGQPHQHFGSADRRGAFDAETVAVEQQRQIVEAQVVGKAPRAFAPARRTDRSRNSSARCRGCRSADR